MSTLRDTLTNYRNAQHSRARRTKTRRHDSRDDPGKEPLSRLDGLVPTDEKKAIAERAAVLSERLRPVNAYEEWLIELVAYEVVKYVRVRNEHFVQRYLAALRATLFWHEDSRHQAALLAAHLSADPQGTTLALRQTSAGCELLLDRWTALGRALKANGQWTEPQRKIALDLLGTPAYVRAAGFSDLDLVEPEADLRSVCELIVVREIEGLKTRLASQELAEIEAQKRAALAEQLRLLEILATRLAHGIGRAG